MFLPDRPTTLASIERNLMFVRIRGISLTPETKLPIGTGK